MDPGPEGGVEYHPTVAEFVAELLDGDRSGARQRAGGLDLFVQVIRQVVPCRVVEALRQGAVAGRVGVQEPAQGDAQRIGATDLVAVPERQFGGLPGCGGHQYTVGGDVLDPPARAPQGEDVADAGLVDHLFVELAHSLVGVGPGQEHPEMATVGNRARVRDGQALGTGPAREQVVGAVPHQAGSQTGELL